MAKRNWTETAASLATLPGPALLAAGGYSQAIAALLPSEEAALYTDFHQAMVNWFEKKNATELLGIYEKWWPRFSALSETKPQYSKATHPASLAQSAAHLQMHAVIGLVPGRVLPGDSFYDIAPEHYAELGKKCAKRSSLKIFQRRIDALIANKKKPWKEQQERSRRMGWQHPIKDGGFDKPKRNAVVALACGEQAKWMTVGGDQLLRVEDIESASVIRVSAEDRERLMPWLPAAT